jgi:hypothetical protein
MLSRMRPATRTNVSISAPFDEASNGVVTSRPSDSPSLWEHRTG